MKGYNNKTLVNNTDMQIGSKIDIDKDHKNFPRDVLKIVIPATRHDPAGTTRLDNLKMIPEKYNDKKLSITFLIFGGGLIAYHF